MHLSLLNECRGRVEQALSSLGPISTRDTRHEMRLHTALGASLIYTKGPTPGTGAAWTSALEIAEKLDDTECQLQALRGLWAYHLNSAEYPASLTLAKRFCSVATVGDGSAEQLIGNRMVGTSLHYLGDQTNARHHIERMLAGYVAHADRPHAIRFQFDQRVTAHATLSRILWLQGFRIRRAEQCRGRSINRSCAFIVQCAGRRGVSNRPLHRRSGGCGTLCYDAVGSLGKARVCLLACPSPYL